MATLKDILILLAILALYGVAGHLDYEDAVRLDELMQASQREVQGSAPTSPAKTIGRSAAAVESTLIPVAPKRD